MIDTAAAEYLAPAEAGRLLGVTSGRIRQLTQDGRLAFVLTPLGRLIERQSVEDLAAARAQRTPAGAER